MTKTRRGDVVVGRQQNYTVAEEEKKKRGTLKGAVPFSAIFSKAWQPCPEELSLVADLVEDSRVLSALTRVPLYFSGYRRLLPIFLTHLVFISRRKENIYTSRDFLKIYIQHWEDAEFDGVYFVRDGGRLLLSASRCGPARLGIADPHRPVPSPLLGQGK